MGRQILRRLTDGSQLQVTRNGDYSLGNIQGGNDGDVTLNLKTPNTTGYTDYGYTIKYGDESVKTGDFDTGGCIVVTDLENDKIYSIEINLSELPEYLDEVVTVADLIKSIRRSNWCRRWTKWYNFNLGLPCTVYYG